jgi:hypothetical protein
MTDTILVYNADNGTGATALIGTNGNLERFVDALSGFSSWTHITGTGSGGVLFYNASTGEGATAALDNGNYSFVGDIHGFSTGWTHIVSATNVGFSGSQTSQSGLLFYNASTGEGATATLDSIGNYSFVGAISGFSKGWTHITGTEFGGVLFYNASTGEGATATLDSNGNYSFVGDIHGFSTGWTHIVSANNGSLLFYNAANGTGATATLGSIGNYSFVGSLSGFSRWTHITGTEGGSVLFYNASTGEGATATLDSIGNYSFVADLHGLPTGWTIITAGAR